MACERASSTPHEPTPIGGPSSAPLPSRSILRTRVDPVGPPSEVIDPAVYLKRVEQALDRASAKVKQVEAGWAALDDEARVRLRDRCSAANLLEESTVLYDDAWVRGDVHQWTNFRWLPQPPPTRREDDPDDEAELEEHDDGEAQERAGSPTAPGSWSGVTLEGHPDVEPCFEAVEQSSLRILRPPQVAHFVRKTGLADYNSLPALRASALDGPRPTHKDPLTHVLYTLTFHFIPRLNSSQSFSQRQTIACTGSNTLEQLRANLTVGGDNIPIEDHDGSSADESDGASERGEGEGTPPVRPGISGRFGGEGDEGRRTRWKDERRETGCAFIAEGLVYADNGENKQDYAALILDGIEQVEWPDSEAAPQQPSTSTAHPADDELLPLDAVAAGPTTSTAMRAAATRPPVRPGPQGKPQLQRGPSLGGAKLGEIPLRVGQPYLFVHQGNNEHIWTVDEIRYLHPSDPPPFPPPSANIRSNAFKHFLPPFPLTTFLSRTSATGKCSLCERDPGELLTIDDERAGETPAILCRACFDLLHPVPKGRRRRAAAGQPVGEASPPKKKGKRVRAEVAEPVDKEIEEEVPDEEREGMDGVQVIPLLVER